jgi:hypothetical protein
MKTAAIQLTVILMMIATASFAQQKSDSDVYAAVNLKGTDKVEIRMMMPDDETAVLKVYDETRKNLLTKRISNKNNLLISHIITDFPSGTYTYEVKSGQDLITSTCIVKKSGQNLFYKPSEEFAEAK